MPDVATLRLWLAEAKEARHLLATGKQVSDVWVMEYGRTRYSPATINELNRYIGQLEADIAKVQDGARSNAPIQLIW